MFKKKIPIPVCLVCRKAGIRQGYRDAKVKKSGQRRTQFYSRILVGLWVICSIPDRVRLWLVNKLFFFLSSSSHKSPNTTTDCNGAKSDQFYIFQNQRKKSNFCQNFSCHKPANCPGRNVICFRIKI